MLSKVRIVLWALVAVAAVSATVIYFTKPIQPSGAMFGGPFEMVSTVTGETFTEEDLLGTPTLMFFGFTHCPDVCPTTLDEIEGWRQSLDLGPDELRTIFVTVDPERDTPEILNDYLARFDGRVIALVGDNAQTEQIKRSYGVFSEKVQEEGAAYYTVNHTASVFMIDEEGDFFGTIAWGEDSETARDKIRRLTEI